MAAAQVGAALRARSAAGAVLREGVVTDNGGRILDVHGLAIDDPAGARDRDQPVARRRLRAASSRRHRATVCLLGTAEGVRTLTFLTRRESRARKARNLRPVHAPCSSQEGRPVAKPNYSFEKRQRELAKKKKKEEKEKEKAGRKARHRRRPATRRPTDRRRARQAPADPAMGPTGG